MIYNLKIIWDPLSNAYFHILILFSSLPEYEAKNSPKRITRMIKMVYGTYLSKGSSTLQEGAPLTVTCTGNSSNIAWFKSKDNKKISQNKGR